MSTVLISLAVNGRENYVGKSIRLEESLANFWCYDVQLYKSFPFFCTIHSDVPYKFKYDLIERARDNGSYQRVVWLDSSMRLPNASKDVCDLFLNNDSGIIAFHNLGHPLKNYISDRALEILEVTETDLELMSQTWGGALGFDFSKLTANLILNDMVKYSEAFHEGGSVRDGFVAHRHDQAVLSVLLWRYKVPLIPYGKILGKEHLVEPFPYGVDPYIIYG